MDIQLLSKEVIGILIKNKFTLGTMESCTSGSLCSTLTNISGSSEAIKGGIITYSTDMKIKYGVNEYIIKDYTVYSNECAKEMSSSARINTYADIGIGVTGCLGRIDTLNEGGDINKVYYNINIKGNSNSFEINVPNGDREAQKEFVVESILENLIELLNLIEKICI